ncbi:MAG: trypsin-like peptidase domain-containing protein [Alphaproteobacteria bacterium]|nr:trypsin-like peptidase domain-containing protein [Alphaproteobacteria bacterium]MDP6564038.1 trypsin-like peptidase domain-containing protein [Alphaproteobacteria bacterium]MDP6812235.1 trypsin-like peptidase domain-containing protein [Alphaproteobacteria bacterium]
MPLEDLFQAVNGSVVLVRTWESVAVARDGVTLVPVTDLGSGVLISTDGDVLTAAHVVQVADVVRVEFADGTTVGAKVVASDPAVDLAVLRLERVPAGAVVAKMGDSDAVRIGQRVFVIGAPYGLSHTLTVGHISARHPPGAPGRPFNFAELFQADVAINRGNSGGPMFDMNGKVIGIVSYILSRSGAFEGVGFAVTAKSIQEMLLARRSPWSGISVFSLDRTLAAILNLPQDSGLLVQRVAKNSPGARIGLVPSYLPAKIGKQELMLGGDIILEVDGIQVGTRESYLPLRRHLAEIEMGQTIMVKILRHGRVIELKAVREE